MRRNLFLYYFVLMGLGGYAQRVAGSTDTIETAEVKWVRQLPEIQNKPMKKRRSFLFVLGKIVGVNEEVAVSFNKPMSIVMGSDSSIWVLDQGNATIIVIKNNQATIPHAFSKGKNDFQSLVSVCRLADRGFLFSDSRLNRLFLLDRHQKRISVFADSVAFNQPTGIAYDAGTGKLWVVETAAHCITLLDAEGHKIRSFGKRGDGDGEFNYPTAICLDKWGNAYVVDALNYRIQVFDAAGNFLLRFGSAGNASGYFGMPKGIAVDSYGDIYVTDVLFHLVQIFDGKGRFLYSFGTQGREVGQFWMPSGIFIDGNNMIYIADSYNSRIQIFSLENIVLKK